MRQSPYPMDTYVNILEALSTIIQPDVTDGTTVLHRAEHFTTTNTSRHATHQHSTHKFRRRSVRKCAVLCWLICVFSGTVSIEPRQGRDTMFGVYVSDPEDHLIKSVMFRGSPDTNCQNKSELRHPTNQSSKLETLSRSYTLNSVRGSAVSRRGGPPVRSLHKNVNVV